MAKIRNPRIPRVKPKFTVKKFMSGIADFEEGTAKHFLFFVRKKIEDKQYDFDIIERNITREKIDKETLTKSLVEKKGIVFVQKGKLIDEITYRELLTILEYGRRDKGIEPQPVIRTAFTEYSEIYKNRLKNFLLGKKD